MDCSWLGSVARRWLLAVAAVVCGGGDAAGLAPSGVVVFGDSLSDMGNISSATLGFVPGSTYFSGRFSNGPVWVEHLAAALGAGPLATSRSGGNNFAYGGALTSGASGVGGVFIRDIDEQLADFFAARTVDPQALYVVWAGANDLFDGQTNVHVPINNLAAAISSLVAAGARQVLVPNLPLLGQIPEYNRDGAASAAFDQFSLQYNAALAARVEQLAAANLQTTFYQLDVAAIFTDAIARPAAWGLTNVTDPAAPGLTSGALFYNRSRIVPNPQQYLFWDAIHPTATVHRILGEYAGRLLDGLPGDFNTDGQVDAADLALWYAGYGTTDAVRRQGDADDNGLTDGADFLLWQQRLGANVLTHTLATTTPVPEPGAAWLAAVGAVWVAAAARGRRVDRRGGAFC
ncbi:MAG TPA: SGNH/GDSL hydrolase family protein [Lacipirellulaceae bacterium]|nr:SGNH/GDSL hydrolase family protein [Lacipirellulaceae bacterium]